MGEHLSLGHGLEKCDLKTLRARGICFYLRRPVERQQITAGVDLIRSWILPRFSYGSGAGTTVGSELGVARRDDNRCRRVRRCGYCSRRFVLTVDSEKGLIQTRLRARCRLEDDHGR